MKKFLQTLKETFLTSTPLAAVIVIVCCFIAPMDDPFNYVKLIIGYAGVVIGQSLFLIGLDICILPIGKEVGASLEKFKQTFFVVFFGFLFGLLATAAEPAVNVFAHQTHLVMNEIHEKLFVFIMSAGIGMFVGFALYRIIKNISIKVIFAVCYIITFAAAWIAPPQFVALAFDGSGATTGDISVPFMLALCFGVSAAMSKSKNLTDDTFGMIGIASIGPILTVFLYGIVLKYLYGGELPPAGIYDPGAANDVVEIVTFNIKGVALALFPVIIVFLPFQFLLIKMPRKDFFAILKGIVPVFAGLLIFLACIDFGFAFAGKYIGEVFLDPSRPEWFKWILLVIGFVLGAAIALSEPAVTVLGAQFEELTNGLVGRMTLRLTLATGIGFASALAVVKILTQVNILILLTPLYVIALLLMRFTSKLFVGLAFDSGGVTGGALTSAFLTPLCLGIAQAVAATAGAEAQSVLTNGFGIISFVSVTPMIAIQVFAIFFNRKLRKAGNSLT